MEAYCPQMGMILEIEYCINMNNGLPCRNFIGCWRGRIDIDRLLFERFSIEELKKAFQEIPKSKLERIINALNTSEKHG